MFRSLLKLCHFFCLKSHFGTPRNVRDIGVGLFLNFSNRTIYVKIVLNQVYDQAQFLKYPILNVFCV